MAPMDATSAHNSLPFWQAQPLPQVSVHAVTAKDLNAQLAQDIAQRLRDAMAARGVAVLSVSGGKSPIALFEALRVQALDWHKVRVTLVDERCVPRTHPDSNALLVRTHLLQDAAAHAQLVDMVVCDTQAWPAPVAQAQAAGVALRAAGTADVLVLGMGTDGHTASLFPEAPNLEEALDRHNPQACVAIELAHPPANAPYARITQTLSQLLTARHIVLPIAGEDKLRTLQQAWPERQQHAPISYVLHQTQTPVAVWLTT